MKAMAENDIPINSSPDEQLGFKKRARRRLVGAIALALLAVIVLPMVMEHDPKPLTQDIQIRIPSQEKASVPGVAAALPAPAKGLAPQQPASVESKPVAPLSANPETKPQDKPDAQAAVKTEAKPEQKTALVKVEPPKAVISAQPPSTPNTASETAAKAPAKPAENAQPNPVKKSESKSDNARPPAGEQWVLQLGAYQDQANVRLLQSKIKELGYVFYTEKVDTPQGARIRVRAGPFATREAAERAQARLKKIGAGGPPGGVVAKK